VCFFLTDDLDLCIPSSDHPRGEIIHSYAVGETNRRLYEQAKVSKLFTLLCKTSQNIHLVKAAAEDGDFVLTLGGDHSIGVGTCAAQLAVRPDTGSHLHLTTEQNSV